MNRLAVTIRRRGEARPERQSGAVLFVGLVILIGLILLGVVYSQSAIIQERLAGNYRDLSVAFEAGEAGGRWGAAWLQSLAGNSLNRPWPCVSGCDQTSAVWDLGQYPTHPGPSASFWAAARTYGIDPSNDQDLGQKVPGTHEQPRFVIEQQFFKRDDLAGEPQKGVAFYRVTAKGTGERANSDAVLRSVLAKRFE